MPKDAREGFFTIPLHRLFSYYFNRLIMQNYLKEISTTDKSPKDLVLDIIRRFIDPPSAG